MKLFRPLTAIAAAVLTASVMAPATASAAPASDCASITFTSDLRLNVGESARVDIVRKANCKDARVVVEYRANSGPWSTVADSDERARHLVFQATGLAPSFGIYRVRIEPSKGAPIKAKRGFVWL